MLNNLYRKLYALFVISVMVIISFVVVFALANSVRSERENEASMFQRMTTLMIYQLENLQSNKENTAGAYRDAESTARTYVNTENAVRAYEHMESAVKAYEDKYGLAVRIESRKGEMIYQSELSFPTEADVLFRDILTQIGRRQSTSAENENSFTSQGGIYEINGKENDKYYAIPAEIAASDGGEYSAVFVCRITDLGTVLSGLLPRYMLIWAAVLVCILIITKLLLKKAFVPTERVLKSQKDFVAAASHELKSPLAVMVANVDVLTESKAMDEQAKHAVGVIEAECMRMSRLLKDMLALASSDAKALTMRKSRVDVDTLLIELYETYEQVCAKKGIELKLNLSDNRYPELNTDRDRMFQILCIFMDNALRHAGDNRLLEIQAVHIKRQIEFSVIDHGRGIPDEDKKHIFDRFFSGDKSHANKENFGLGLSIAKELTEALNGKIRVGDTDGGGATFTVCLSMSSI